MIPLREALILRSRAFRAIRDFFLDRGFIEVDPPLLGMGVPVEATLVPFKVDLIRGGRIEPRYLPTSPEAGLKQALALMERNVFELGHAFRNAEDVGPRHRAGFRMLEWYRRHADWRAIMDDTILLFRAVDQALDRPATCNLHGPWEELSVADALERHAGIPLNGPADLEGLPRIVADRGLGTVHTWQDALCTLLAVHVEEHLGWERPTLLTHYPTGIAAQARACDTRPWLAEQFEVYVQGMELGNCYSEITDPEEQRRRFSHELGRPDAVRPPVPVSDAYMEAIGRLPERCAGGSIGVDRLLMVLLGVPDIAGVRLE